MDKEKELKWIERVFYCMVLALGGIFWLSGHVWAQTSTVDLTDVELDTASVLALAAVVLTAIGAIWGIKKLIKLANRS